MNLADSRSHFREQGYCVIENGLSAEEVAALRHATDVLLKEEPDDDGGGRFRNIGRGESRRFLRHRHEDFPEVSRFLFSDRMLRLTSALIGDSPHLFNEQFVVKGPKTGASFAWHQDGAYVGFEHQPYLTVWIALDDTKVENGCLYVLPKNLDRDSRLVPHEWDEAGKELVGHDRSDPGVEVVCPAGTIVAFSPTTLHRSGENRTDRHRRAYICQYSPEPIIDPATNAPKTFAKPLRPS